MDSVLGARNHPCLPQECLIEWLETTLNRSELHGFPRYNCTYLVGVDGSVECCNWPAHPIVIMIIKARLFVLDARQGNNVGYLVHTMFIKERQRFQYFAKISMTLHQTLVSHYVPLLE